MAKTLESLASGPSPLQTRSKMSFEEFLAWDGGPDETKHFEWVDGEAVEMVSMSARHTLVSTFLIHLFAALIDERPIGQIFFDPFVMYFLQKRRGRAPDLLFVRTEHFDRLRDNYLDGPADLAIEVVSPGGTRTDYVTKRREYELGGVPEFWIIDPQAGATTFLVLGDDGIYADAEVDERGRYTSVALDGLTIDPKWFHQEPLPKVLPILRDWGLI